MRMLTAALLCVGLLASPVMAVDQPPVQESREVLDSLYYTVAIVEFCGIPVDPDIGYSVASAGRKLEAELGVVEGDAYRRLDEIKAGFLVSPPDCTPGSADVDDVYRILNPS